MRSHLASHGCALTALYLRLRFGRVAWWRLVGMAVTIA
jgi:hypothetical protein